MACVVFVFFSIDFACLVRGSKHCLQAPGELSDTTGVHADRFPWDSHRIHGKPTWMRKWEDEDEEVEGAPDPSILLAEASTRNVSILLSVGVAPELADLVI